MSLINELREKSITARKGSDTVAKNLLVTLYAECVRVGKDKRNGETTDDECLSVIKKFLENAKATAELLEYKVPAASSFIHEVSILSDLLPKQLTIDELEQAISQIIADKALSDLKGLGQVMASLKATYGSTYDGKAASEITKRLLSQ
jgi:uncharacterized protein YqeY